MFLGAIAGECYWLSVYPIDLCKTKIQSDSLSNPKYKGIVDVFRKTYRAEGLIGFSNGIVPCLCRTPFASGSTFAVFEIVMKYIAPLGATLEE